MLETDEGQAAYYAPGCDIDSGEEGLAVLPRHTKVLVTGNNRTKSVLVGLHGVVKKAVGLGGWHWLVLTNGAQVKLQRNALSVIEAATGQEDDDDIEEDNLFFHGHSLGYSMLLSPNYDYPRTFKTSGQSRCKSTISTSMIASARDGHHHSVVADPAAIDLSKLETAALKRYRRHFKLVEVGPNSSKQQLLDAVGRHFMSQELDEFQVITGFMQAAKRLKA
ncbi:unnamed protein product [Sphagnum jensenii]|uniref:Histone deacetylase complex subunit SAP30 Sin3 binding domain-containing protein n=1 Tax=Sphagnum jensenii TaxID=128206 RepID=A0ABP1BSI0_9BRYO